jgi:2-(1,2-epoxy-1,2-dihydrophenyl)acetyl-CoA isomerase
VTVEDISYAVDGGVGLLTLNRPEKRNAATSEMLRHLLASLNEAAADDDVRAVLLTGEGPAFCVGQDLTDPAASGEEPNLGALLEERWNPVIRAMRDNPKPVVVAVNGAAAGAGLSLALAGDIVLAARSATFHPAFSAIGLVPDSGMSWALPRLVGPARARALAMITESITAEEALELGVVWKVVEDDALLAEAGDLAVRLAAGPTLAYAATKQAIEAAEANTLSEQLDLERDLQRDLGHSADYREGVTAFMEKREPRFEGR